MSEPAVELSEAVIATVIAEMREHVIHEGLDPGLLQELQQVCPPPRDLCFRLAHPLALRCAEVEQASRGD